MEESWGSLSPPGWAAGQIFRHAKTWAFRSDGALILRCVRSQAEVLPSLRATEIRQRGSSRCTHSVSSREIRYAKSAAIRLAFPFATEQSFRSDRQSISTFVGKPIG